MWRAGGARDGKQESERFDDEKQAEAFQGLVKLAGENWPDGWVRGVGFKEPEPEGPEDMPLMDWIFRYIERLNGIESRTRHDYKRIAELHFAPIFPPHLTIATLKPDHVEDWVRAEEQGLPDPEREGKWLRAPASPKTIANHHGLLYSAVQRALEVDPPIRTTNPCAKTRLPRVDDHTDEEMVFLERDEWQRLRAELAVICDGDAVDLADFLIGTGLRWGEATALQVRDLKLSAKQPTLQVQRAWKRQDDNSFKLGPPKTKKSRRTIALTEDQVAMLRRLTIGKEPEAHVFLTTKGKVWRHSNFYYRRWQPAVAEAMRKGLPKKPRPHDLRHTHVSWLIAAKIPLPAIQARLGHESITTTVDRYGHLVRELDAEIAAAVQAALSADSAPGLRLVQSS
jgi:integrase